MSPESTVISGGVAAVELLTARWLQNGVACRTLPVDYAFHSVQMEPFSEELTRLLGLSRQTVRRCRLFPLFAGQLLMARYSMRTIGARTFGGRCSSPLP